MPHLEPLSDDQATEAAKSLFQLCLPKIPSV